MVQMSMNAVGLLMYGAPHRLQKESRLAQKVDYPAYGGASTAAATVDGTSVRSSLRFSLLLPLQRTAGCCVTRHQHFLLSRPSSGRRQNSGPERPNVPLPTPQAADALRRKVGSPCHLAFLSLARSCRLDVSLPVTWLPCSHNSLLLFPISFPFLLLLVLLQLQI